MFANFFFLMMSNLFKVGSSCVTSNHTCHVNPKCTILRTRTLYQVISEHKLESSWVPKRPINCICKIECTKGMFGLFFIVM